MRVRCTQRVKFCGFEVVEHQPSDLRGKNFRENYADAQHQRHHGNDHRKGFLRVCFSLFSQKARVDGDKGNGDCSARDQVGKEIGNLECSNIGVGRRASAKCPGRVSLAQVPHDAREHHGRHQQHRCRKRGVLMRWPEEAQPAGGDSHSAGFFIVRGIRHQRAILHAERGSSRWVGWFLPNILHQSSKTETRRPRLSKAVMNFDTWV